MADNLPERTEHQPDGLIAKWDAFNDATDFAVHSSLPTFNPQERAAVLRLIEGDSLRGGDLIGSEFLFSHYIAHPVLLVSDDTGEVVDAIRLLFPQHDTPPIAFVSTGILKSVGRIAWQVGKPPPYDPPIKVKIKQVNARGAKRTYKLIPVAE